MRSWTEVSDGSSLPLAVSGKLVELARESVDAGLVLIALTPSPRILLAHTRSMRVNDMCEGSLSSLQRLVSLSDVQLASILSSDTGQSARYEQTPTHCLYVDHIHAEASRFVVLVIHESDGKNQRQLSSRVLSLATANWGASLVHAMCQPTHVMQNVAELIEIQHSAGEIVGEPLPRYIDMLRMATVQANEQLGAVKEQFREFAHEPEKTDLVPRLKMFARTIGCELETSMGEAHVNCDPERFEMLLECLAALATDGDSSFADASQPVLVLQSNTSDLELTVRFVGALSNAKDVLKAKGDEILSTAICQVCVNLVDGFFGRIEFIETSASNGASDEQGSRQGCSHVVSTIDGVKITLPKESVNVDKRLPRAVRRIW